MGFLINVIALISVLINVTWCKVDDDIVDVPGDLHTVLFGDLAKIYPSFLLNPPKDISEIKNFREEYLENLKKIFEPFDLKELERFANTSSRRLNKNRRRYNANFTMDIDDMNTPTRRGLFDLLYWIGKAAVDAAWEAMKFIGGVVKFAVLGAMDLAMALVFNYEKDPYEQYMYEQKKIEQAKYATTQYLIHSRYRLQTASQYRTHIRFDKRYQMGYCFCKLRHFLARQRKLMTYAMKDRLSPLRYSSGHTVFAIYERMLRVDIDIKDLIYMIQEIDVLEQDYDDLEENTGSSIMVH